MGKQEKEGIMEKKQKFDQEEEEQGLKILLNFDLDIKYLDDDDEPEENANKYLPEDFDFLKVDDQQGLEYMDEDDLNMQAVLLSSMQLNTYPSEPAHVLKKKEDVKMKGKDESCSIKKTVRYFSYRKNERGECSSTFCVICDDAKPPETMKYNSDCGHSFCEDCIKKYLEEQLQENIIKVPCPDSKCKSSLDFGFCKTLISEEGLELWGKALSEGRALSKRSFIQCPFRDCLEYFQDDHRGFNIRACPNCWRLICVDCKKPYMYHFGKSCAEFLEFLEEKRLLKEKEKLTRWIEEYLKDYLAEQTAGRNRIIFFHPDHKME